MSYRLSACLSVYMSLCVCVCLTFSLSLCRTTLPQLMLSPAICAPCHVTMDPVPTGHPASTTTQSLAAAPSSGMAVAMATPITLCPGTGARGSGAAPS